jgi:hypothetical protein
MEAFEMYPMTGMIFQEIECEHFFSISATQKRRFMYLM